MTILSIFTIEVTLRMARNTKKFFKKKFNIVDMAIVYISVVLEIILLAVPKSTWCGDDDGRGKQMFQRRFFTKIINFRSKFIQIS